jgi:G:T-mismatch repair DNA endonuclease (very short patch repair protein)
LPSESYTVVVTCSECRRTFRYLGSFHTHRCLSCAKCGRSFHHLRWLKSHLCSEQLVKCAVCNQRMPVITNSHLKLHGMTPESYTAYGSPMHSLDVRAKHTQRLLNSNPNLMPGVKEKQSENNAMRNPEHRKKQKAAVGTEEGQRKRHATRKKRAKDARYTSRVERWLGDLLGAPPEHRRYWVRGAGEVDLAFPDVRIAIEVQGCYWHGCVPCGYLEPGNKGQRVRDETKADKLDSLGWTLFTIWEHDLVPLMVAQASELKLNREA